MIATACPKPGPLQFDFSDGPPKKSSRCGTWVKPKKLMQLEDFQKPEFSSVLWKKGKTFHLWVSRKYYLCQNLLLYTTQKKPNIIKGYIDLNAFRCGFSTTYDSSKPFTMTFKRDQAVINLHTDDRKLFYIWQKYLRPRVLLTDFKLRYSSHEIIGQGGNGKVHLVQEAGASTSNSFPKKDDVKSLVDSSNILYAAKVIDKKNLKPNFKQALLNEINILRSLDHPNVIKLYEIHDLDNEICLVMDFVKGGELLKKLNSRGVYSEAECAIILKSLLQIVLYLQSKGIAHKDLKLENILLEDPNDISSLVLIDFGLASTFNSETISKSCGTPGYIAPELLNKTFNNLPEKIDVFSVGCIFHKLLTGNSPFYGLNLKEVAKANGEGNVNYNSIALSFISPCAKNLLQRLLEKDPLKRCSAKEALDHEFFLMRPDELAENVITIDRVIPDLSPILHTQRWKDVKLQISPPNSKGMITQTITSFSPFSGGHCRVQSAKSNNNENDATLASDYTKTFVQTNPSLVLSSKARQVGVHPDATNTQQEKKHFSFPLHKTTDQSFNLSTKGKGE